METVFSGIARLFPKHIYAVSAKGFELKVALFACAAGFSVLFPQVWEELIFFRDYLIHHPKKRKEYANIKEQAVQKNQEGEAYRKIKDPFLQKILKNMGQR